MALDAVKNFAKVTVSTGYSASDTTVVLNSGDGAKLPAPPFNVVWWEWSDYRDPADDPAVEIVRVTNIVSDTLTITRAQEGTSATSKNTGGKTYKMVAGPTAKTVTDLATPPSKRYAISGSYSYCGVSTAGSDPAAATWYITRLTFGTDGSLITTAHTPTHTAVWNNYLTETYV